MYTPKRIEGEKMVNFAVVGSDPRAAMFALKLVQEGNRVFSIGNKPNLQISFLVNLSLIVNKNITLEQLIEWLKARKTEMVVFSSEDDLYLEKAFRKAGIGVIGPKGITSKIELDKAWTVELMTKYGIPGLPESRIFTKPVDYIKATLLIGEWKNVVIKPAWPTGGKGVKATGDQLKNIYYAMLYVKELLDAGQTVVIQRKLTGIEFVIHAFVDHNGNIIFAPALYDNKRRFDSAENLIMGIGLNTGSMGTLKGEGESLPFLLESDIETAKGIMRQSIAAVKIETGISYEGILYGQFMVTKDGIFLIEFNARFGSPEAVNILFGYKNLTKTLLALAEGRLDKIKPGFSSRSNVVKCVVQKNYPDSRKMEQVIVKLMANGNVKRPIELLYGGSSAISEDLELGDCEFVSNDGRILVFCAEGKSIPEASSVVNNNIELMLGGCKAFQEGKLDWRRGIGSQKQIKALVEFRQQLAKRKF